MRFKVIGQDLADTRSEGASLVEVTLRLLPEETTIVEMVSSELAARYPVGLEFELELPKRPRRV